MIAGIIIGALIVLYCIWVVRRRVRQIRQGQYCSCGCGGCSHNCGSKKRREISDNNNN